MYEVLRRFHRLLTKPCDLIFKILSPEERHLWTPVKQFSLFSGIFIPCKAVRNQLPFLAPLWTTHSLSFPRKRRRWERTLLCLCSSVPNELLSCQRLCFGTRSPDLAQPFAVPWHTIAHQSFSMHGSRALPPQDALKMELFSS